MRSTARAAVILAACLGLVGLARPVVAGTIVRFEVLGNYSMDVELYDDQVPETVANFLAYVDAGSYTNSIFHRSTTGNPQNIQVVQGGGFTLDQSVISPVATGSAIALQAVIPNTRGTIAMARGEDPDTATCQWYFNVTDNPSLDRVVDPNSGAVLNAGYSVFGRIVADTIPPLNPQVSGLALLDQIAALQAFDLNEQLGTPGGPFATVPLIQQDQNFYFVRVTSVAAVPEPSTLVLAGVGVAMAVAGARRKRRPRSCASLVACGADRG